MYFYSSTILHFCISVLLHFYSNSSSRRRDTGNKFPVKLKFFKNFFSGRITQLFSGLRKTRKMDVCPTTVGTHSLKGGWNTPCSGLLRAPESLCNVENRKNFTYLCFGLRVHRDKFLGPVNGNLIGNSLRFLGGPDYRKGKARRRHLDAREHERAGGGVCPGSGAKSRFL